MINHSLESTYEYRVKNLVKSLLQDYEIDTSKAAPEDVFDFLFENRAAVGKALIEDMEVWMEDSEWLELFDG